MASAANELGSWIRRYHSSPLAKARLFCFPFAGGSASYFFPFSRSLAPEIEVLAVQYPGRHERHSEPCIDSIPGLADGVFEDLAGQDDRPFAFFGHSLGSMVALEVALRLRHCGRQGPVWLFASGGRPRSYRAAGFRAPRTEGELLAELRALGGTDERFFRSPELQSLILPAMRADYHAVATYEPPPPGRARVGCPITALIGDADPRTTPQEAVVWREYTTGAFDLRVLPGGHFYLDDCRSEVIDAISTILGALTPGSGASIWSAGAKHAI